MSPPTKKDSTVESKLQRDHQRFSELEEGFTCCTDAVTGTSTELSKSTRAPQTLSRMPRTSRELYIAFLERCAVLDACCEGAKKGSGGWQVR